MTVVHPDVEDALVQLAADGKVTGRSVAEDVLWSTPAWRRTVPASK